MWLKQDKKEEKEEGEAEREGRGEEEHNVDELCYYKYPCCSFYLIIVGCCKRNERIWISFQKERNSKGYG